MKVTLKDIAEETGYSISTVSRVLNGSDKISNKTTEKIFRTAKRLNYPILKNKNGDSTEKTLKIIFAAPEFSLGEFYASLYHGLTVAALKSNIHLSFINLPLSFKQSLDMIGEVGDSYSNFSDGMIIYAPEFEHSDYQKLVDRLPDNFPIVSNALIENPVITTVSFDGYSGGFLAGGHFLKRGYRKCGIIKGPLEKSEARYRFNGFRDFISQNPSLELVWSYHGNFGFRSGKKAFQDFEKAKEKPRAIFASNDNMAHAFLEEAMINGYKVPEDIAVIGYDDLPICNRHRPQITSIHTDYEKLGMVTMEKLKEIIANPALQQGVLSLVPVSLEVRDSS